MFVIAIFKCAYDIFNGEYDTSAWNLPFLLSMPFNTETVKGWFLLLFIQLNVSIFYSLIMIAATSYFICGCLYIGAICDHFDVLIDTIEKDVETNQLENNSFKYKKREQEIWKCFCNAIEIHGDVHE